MRLPDRRYLLWGVVLLALLLLPLRAGFTGIGWELSEWAGYASALACLVLSGSPVRPRAATPPVLLSLGAHRAWAWFAVGAAALHVLVAVAADRTVIEYLKPTLPLYQLAGVIAMLALLTLTLSSLDRARRRLWHSHRSFQATHIVIGCLLLACLGVHLVATDRYLNGHGRRSLFIAAAAAALAMLLRRRRQVALAPNDGRGQRRLAFGRHSRLVATAIGATLLALTPLSTDRAAVALREPLLTRAQALSLDFPHDQHVVVNCLVCHHNYVDGRGFETCISCHRSSRTDLKLGVEARFHSFCLDCHRNPAAALVHHGPVSGCSSCHRRAGLPRKQTPAPRQ